MGYVELVFRREGRFQRWCARKRLHEQLRSDPAFRSMFMDEARLAGLVRHPNAVGVLDVGEDEEGPYLIMDFVEGVPLSRLVAEAAAAGRPLPMQLVVRICVDASRGLHAAHEVRSEEGTSLRLVHRDVSPQNILIGFDGTVRVTDFGIAKALGNVTRTSVGVLKGNMGYLSPEQLRFEEPDRRSDLFSLGVTLYEMLAGQRLYPNKDGFDGTRRILAEPPPDIGEVRNDVPAELCELLFELLAKDRESRPATAAEVASRLEGVMATLIAEEGSITVADYMNQHFAEQREQQSEQFAEYLRRIERGSSFSLRAVPITMEVPALAGPSPAVRARRYRVPVLLGGAALALVLAYAAWSWTHARIPAGEAAGPSEVTPTAAPGDQRVAGDRLAGGAVTPSRALPAAAMPVALPAARAPERQGTAAASGLAASHPQAEVRKPKAASRRHKMTRSGTRHRASPSEQAAAPDSERSNHLAVPLFTQWQ